MISVETHLRFIKFEQATVKFQKITQVKLAANRLVQSFVGRSESKQSESQLKF